MIKYTYVSHFYCMQTCLLSLKSGSLCVYFSVKGTGDASSPPAKKPKTSASPSKMPTTLPPSPLLPSHMPSTSGWVLNNCNIYFK